jgi:integral membrane protein (TIGR01906 family)
MIKKTCTIICILFFAIALAGMVWFSTFHFLLHNNAFYEKQFEKNGVYERYGEETTNTESQEILTYIKDKHKEIINSDFFSDRDKQHMIDVKYLIQKTYPIKYALTAIVVFMFLPFLILNRKQYNKILHDLFEYTGALLIALPIISGVATFIFQDFFTKAFTQFHYWFFNNDLWILDSRVDNLINLFPESFFEAFTVRIIIYGMIVGIALLVLSHFLKKLIKLITVLIRDFDRWGK